MRLDRPVIGQKPTSKERGHPRVEGQGRESGGVLRRMLQFMAILAAGAILGAVLVQALSCWQDHHRQKLARQKADALFDKLVPKTEMELKSLRERLEELQTSVTQANMATNSSKIKINFLEARQKSLELQRDRIQSMVRRLDEFAEQARRRFQLPAGRDVLTDDHQSQLALIGEEHEQAQARLRALTREIETAKDHWRLLNLAEVRTKESEETSDLTETNAAELGQATIGGRVVVRQTKPPKRPPTVSTPAPPPQIPTGPTIVRVPEVTYLPPAVVNYSAVPLVVPIVRAPPVFPHYRHRTRGFIFPYHAPHFFPHNGFQILPQYGHPLFPHHRRQFGNGFTGFRFVTPFPHLHSPLARHAHHHFSVGGQNSFGAIQIAHRH